MKNAYALKSFILALALTAGSSTIFAAEEGVDDLSRGEDPHYLAPQIKANPSNEREQAGLPPVKFREATSCDQHLQLVREGTWNSAFEVARCFNELDPSYSKYAYQDDPQEAVRWYQAGLRHGSKGYEGLARAFLASGDKARALKAFSLQAAGFRKNGMAEAKVQQYEEKRISLVNEASATLEKPKMSYDQAINTLKAAKIGSKDACEVGFNPGHERAMPGNSRVKCQIAGDVGLRVDDYKNNGWLLTDIVAQQTSIGGGLGYVYSFKVEKVTNPGSGYVTDTPAPTTRKKGSAS